MLAIPFEISAGSEPASQKERRQFVSMINIKGVGGIAYAQKYEKKELVLSAVVDLSPAELAVINGFRCFSI